MHRLVIVAGPNRGSAFSLIEGENSIGRQMDNHIVLTSSKVSKRHCALLVTTQEVILRDEGSTNGTFVNGALTKRQTMKPGDKLGVGEFVLELVRSGGAVAQVQTGNTGGFPMPTEGGMLSSNPFDLSVGSGALALPGAAPVPNHSGPASIHEAKFDQLVQKQEIPQDPVGKVKFLFEGKFMPIFYGWLMKNEFSGLLAVLIGVAFLLAVGVSVMPMEELAEQGIQREARIRGTVIAREVADRYAPHFVQHTESQIDFSMLTQEDSIKIVTLLNMDLNIIAPQSRLGQLFSIGGEAGFAKKMIKEFREGREKGGGMFINSHTYVHIEPIKAADPRTYANQVVALALVSIDFSRNMMAAGSEIAYGTAIIYTAGIAILLYLILLRLTQKPFEVMNDDLDQVLRGEIPRVTKEFKLGSLEKLWDNVNAAVQRMGKADAAETEGVVAWDQEFAPWNAIAEAGQMGLIGFDANLVMVTLNPYFAEVSGIRTDLTGQTLAQVGDQAMISLVTEVKSTAERSGVRSATDKFEFQGIDYAVVATLVGPRDQQGLALLFRKKEG